MKLGKLELAVVISFFLVMILSSSGVNLPLVVSAAPDPYQGSGGDIDIYEFARNDSLTFKNGVNDTAFSYLASRYPSNPSPYFGYRLHSEVSNLFQIEDPVPNGEFSQTEPGTAWVETLNTRGLVEAWGNTTGGNPDDCLEINLDFKHDFDASAEANYDNVFSYTSDKQPFNSTLEFDIKYSGDITKKTELEIKVALIYHTSEIGSWSATTDAYHPTSWSPQSFSTAPVNGTVTLRIFIIYTGGKKNDLDGNVYFDNFQYRILTQRSPTEVSLTLNNTAFLDTGIAQGHVDVYADTPNKEQALIGNCWSTTQLFQFYSSHELAFDYSYSMYIKTENTDAASTTFTAPVDTDPTWEITYTTPSPLPPTGYSGYTFGLFLQTGWFLTSVENDTGDTISEYEFNITSRFIWLDEGIAGPNEDFSIFASSTNYVQAIYPQISATGTGGWTNLSSGEYYVKGDYLRIMAKIQTLDPVTNIANITVFFPNDTKWQSDATPDFFLANDTIVSAPWLVSSIDPIDAGSEWHVTVSYNSPNQCGMREQAISIVIETTATKVTPPDGTRVISGDTVTVEVFWENLDTSAPITDATARIRYLDRNMQVQTVGMTADGLGGYSLIYFSTSLMRPSTTATFGVELFRYGYVNASYSEGTQIDFTINLVNNINYVMIKPTQQTGPDEFTAETSRSQGYTTLVKFYDPFQSAYVLNETSLWPKVLVQFDYYEDTGSGFGSSLYSGSFSENATTRTFYKDETFGPTVQRVKYVVTMRIEDASWEFEQQNFTIIINVVSWATNLDAVRTSIAYPPSGTGDGWTAYNNVTDTYEVHLYWDESFTITVYYENLSSIPTPEGIESATVRILIDETLYPLTEMGNGNYSYTLNTNSYSVGILDLYVNATFLDHASQTIRIRLIINARTTQLVSDYLPTTKDIPYDSDFSVLFTFTDEVSSSVPITNAVVSVTGYVSGKYSITNHGDGTYTITFEGDITEGAYYVTILFERTNYASKSKYYEITVRPIHTGSWASAENPSVPWGTTVVITLQYNDTDNGSLGIPGATIAFSWMDNIEGVDYWLTDNSDGTYTITLATSKVAYGTQGYTVSFTLSKTHYDSDQIDVSFQVRDILTTLFIVDTLVMGTTTTSVPWGETLTLILHFNDTENGLHIPAASISCNWDPGYWDVIYNGTDHAYYLTIYTDNTIEGGHVIQIYASKIHYVNGFNIQSFVVREIQTSLSAIPSYVASWPWGDNLTIQLTYQDLDHGGTFIPYATTTTDWNAGFYTFYDYGNGTYLLVLNTTCRVIGQHSIQITLSESLLSPHYAERTLTLLVKLDPIPLIVTVQSPPGGQNITSYNDLQILTVNVTDHLGRPINDATTVYEWAGRNNVTMTFLGNGIYTFSFLANATPGSWIVTIIASNLPNYRDGSSSIVLTIKATETKLVAITLTPVNAVANTSFIFTVNFTTLNGQPIEGAVVTFSLGPHNGFLLAISPGIYEATIPTTNLGAGQYTLYVSASKATMETKWNEFPVFLTKIPCSLEPEVSFLNVDWGHNFTINVYFNDTHNNLPIDAANIIYNWETLNGSLVANGTAGWYTITLPSTVYPADSFYSVTFTVDHAGYQYSLAVVTVNIRRQSTDLVLTQAEAHYQTITRQLNTTPWDIPWSDTLVLSFNYTDGDGISIANAIGAYTWELGSGTLQFIEGLYVCQINFTGVSGIYGLQVIISKQNYDKGISEIYTLNITRSLTEIAFIEGPPPTVTAGTPFQITIRVTDYYHNRSIPGANVSVEILEYGQHFTMYDNQDGTYSIMLTLPQPNVYHLMFYVEVDVRFETGRLGPIQVVALTSPIIQNTINGAAIIAVIGIIVIAVWFAYTRVFSVPWLVRKMRKMSQAIGKGRTPSLSKVDVAKITSRPDLLHDMTTPAYRSIGLAASTIVIPVEIDWAEKEAEDEAIWSELKNLPFIEYAQKLELFQQMKQLPPGERVWFIEDLRKQMTDGTRFDRKSKEPEISEDLEKLLRARLALFPALSDLEKTRIAAQLRKMPKEDWDEIFDTLAISQVSREDLEPEILRPDEFPSLTEEERRKILEQIEGLTDEEREKVLKTFREKHDKPKSKGKKEETKD
ncbi:MAG: hypothetical protein ACFE9O_00200 [Promethearchaeota archaeon]